MERSSRGLFQGAITDMRGGTDETNVSRPRLPEREAVMVTTQVEV